MREGKVKQAVYKDSFENDIAFLKLKRPMDDDYVKLTIDKLPRYYKNNDVWHIH
jgi:hypothetical protein